MPSIYIKKLLALHILTIITYWKLIFMIKKFQINHFTTNEIIRFNTKNIRYTRQPTNNPQLEHYILLRLMYN